MEESKTLVEQLREMVELSIESNQDPTVHADAIIGHLCVSKIDVRELFTAIAYRIEREYMPLPLLEWEPLKVGDRVDGYGQDGAEVVAVMNSDMVVVRSTVKGGYGYHDEAYPLMLWSVDELKRHRREVLDADGVQINVGDVVYFVDNAEAFDVLGVESDGDEPVHIGRNDGTSTDAWVSPGELTHKQPDTLERIEKDAMKTFNDYWGCENGYCLECPSRIDGKTPDKHYGVHTCAKAQKLDLLRRQRELLERGQA